MAALQEVEIFECMAENLRIAADRCKTLAYHPRRGWQYLQFCDALKKVEGTCRQAYYWRNYDARWLYLGGQMEELHRRAGNWIRTLPSKDDRANIAHPRFLKLTEVLEGAYRTAVMMKDASTGKTGMILPTPLPHTRTEGRLVQVSKGGVLIPDGVSVAA